MINIGIIGAGAWGEKHAEAIGDLSEARLIASSRTNTAHLQTFTEKYGGVGYTDYRDLLDDPHLDAVVIATPHHLHTQIVIDAARAGKHILLEKPMAPSLAECDQILRAVEAAKVTFMPGHTNHFVPVYIETKALVNSGELGEPLLITDRTLKRWWVPNRREWHLDRETGGGMWMTIGVHNIDRMIWLLDSHAQSICAHMGTGFYEQNADDHAMAFIRFANGTAGTVITVGYETGAPSFDTEIVCTKGLVRVDKMKGEISVARDESWEPISGSHPAGLDTWMTEAMIGEWQAFIKAIESSEPPAVTGEFGRHVMAVIFAAEQSARLKQEVIITG